MRRRPRGAVARPSRSRHGGQTTIEFAFVFVIMLMGLFGSISAAAWTVQNMGAVSAEELGIRIAAAANGVNNQADSVSQSMDTAAANMKKQVRSSMWGTTVLTRCPAAAPPAPACDSYGACPSPPTFNVAHQITICVQRVNSAGVSSPCNPPGPGCPPAVAPFQVQFMIYGCSASMIPKWGLGKCPQGLPINNFAAVQALVFQQ